MSDDEWVDVPEATVDAEVERAAQMLADAKKAHEAGISKATVVNRLYYACFHAAQAALYARGFDPQLTGGFQTRLGQEVIQPGDVPRELGWFLDDMQTYRSGWITAPAAANATQRTSSSKRLHSSTRLDRSAVTTRIPE